VDASGIDGKHIDSEDGKFKIKKTGLNNEYVTSKDTIGPSYLVTPERRVTSNQFDAMSKLANSNGGSFVFHWQNSDASAIVPGMPAKIVYMDHDVLKEI
jgi:hypothetical protein